MNKMNTVMLNYMSHRILTIADQDQIIGDNDLIDLELRM